MQLNKFFNPFKQLFINDDHKFNYNFLCFTLSFMSACFVCGIGELLIYYFYHPSTLEILKRGQELLVSNVAVAVQPEPKEKTLFFFALISIPLVFTVHFFLLKNFLLKFNTKTIKNLSSALSVFLVLIFIILGVVSHRDFFYTYFDKSFFYYHYIIYSLITIIFILLLKCSLIIFEKYPITRKIVLSLAFIYIVITLRALYKSGPYNFPPGAMTHAEAVFYSLVQVTGGTPMLTDGLVNTYGLYAQFMAPIFNFATLSFSNMSKSFNILAVAIFIMLFITLYREVKNKFFLYSGILSCIWLFMFWKLKNNDHYFQYYPIRALFPAIVFLLASIYKTSKSKILYYVSFPLLALGVLWNPDHGIGAFLSWVIFVIYVDKNFDKNRSYIYSIARSILKHSSVAVISLFVTFKLYSLTILFFYGSTPNIKRLFDTIKVFSDLGFSAIPMPPFHPWNIELLLTLVGISYAIKKYFEFILSKEKVNPDQVNEELGFSVEMILVICLLSIVTLGYYQSRSHEWTFATILPTYMILLTMLFNAVWNMRKNLFMHFSYGIGIFALLISWIDSSFYIKDYLLYNKPLYTYLESDRQMPYHLRVELNFIRKHVNEGEQVLLWLPTSQALYHTESKTFSAINPCYTDLFLMEDWKRITNELENTKLPKKIFITLDNHGLDSILNKKYDLVDSTFTLINYIMYFRLKKQYDPQRFYLGLQPPRIWDLSRDVKKLKLGMGT
ncbi:MAG: hypothetical protein HQK51_10050 [Oligoflexia bacterium]|nr:hypothetical protein [Oligoflexia bacterium]